MHYCSLCESNVPGLYSPNDLRDLYPYPADWNVNLPLDEWKVAEEHMRRTEGICLTCRKSLLKIIEWADVHEYERYQAKRILAGKRSPLGRAGDHYLACKSMVAILDSILQMN